PILRKQSDQDGPARACASFRRRTPSVTQPSPGRRGAASERARQRVYGLGLLSPQRAGEEAPVHRIPSRLRRTLFAAAAWSLLALSARAASAQVVINEIDYDQPGTDTAEFVELKNVGTISVNLSA